MTRTVVHSLLSLVLVTFAAAGGAQEAYADSASVVNDVPGCTGFIPDPDSDQPWGDDPVFLRPPVESHAVESASGNQVMTCHFRHSEDLDRAVTVRGFRCGTVFRELTTDSRMTATPGGHATLQCKVKANGKANGGGKGRG